MLKHPPDNHHSEDQFRASQHWLQDNPWQTAAAIHQSHDVRGWQTAGSLGSELTAVWH
jgi:hypothetical protein